MWKKVLNNLKSKSKKAKMKLDNSDNKYWHTYKALKESKKSGGIKSVKKSKDGTQYNYKDGTGYWVGK